MSWLSHYDSAMRFMMTGNSNSKDSVYMDSLTCTKDSRVGLSAITSAVYATAMWLFD